MFRKKIFLMLVATFLLYLLTYGIGFRHEQKSKTIPNIEDTLVKRIRTHGLGQRFVIKEIKPKGQMTERITIREKHPGKKVDVLDKTFTKKLGTLTIDFVMVSEFPEVDFIRTYDGTRMSMGGEGESAPYLSLGSKIIGDILFFGEGSIYRFDGQVKLDNYTFIGEGNKLNRLTFVSLTQGFVYVRGKGKVILPEGKEIKLGY